MFEKKKKDELIDPSRASKPVAQMPEPQPTFLALERHRLTEAQTLLHSYQDAVHKQQAVVALHRENIGLLEDNPWVEKLLSDLIEREITARDKEAIQKLVGSQAPHAHI